MKKCLTILLITLLLVSSCSKRGDIQPTILSPDSPCFAEVDDNAVAYNIEVPSTFEVGDGKYDALGNGYDVTTDYSISNGTRFPVIDTDKLYEEYPQYIRVEYPVAGTEYYYINYSSNAYEYMTKLSKQQKETINTPVFTRALSNFPNIYIGSTWGGVFDAGFVCSSFELIVPKKSVAIEAPISVLINYTYGSFQDRVNRLTPENLVEIYGTHIAGGIHIGGRMRLKYVSKTFNSDREYAAKVGMKAYTNNVKGITNPENVNMSLLSKNYRSMTAYTNSGSRNSIIGNDGFDADYWRAGIDEGGICDFWGDNALIPIYDLISDPAKKAEVKAYVEQYIRDKTAKLDYVAEYLYNFYSNEYECNYYNMCSSVPEKYISMGPYHTGKVFSYNAPGTTPVYYFYKSENSKADHYYSTNSSTPQGYTIKGIYFYAYPQQILGTVPVYQYFDKYRNSHYYSTQNNEDSQGVAWYAFPSE